MADTRVLQQKENKLFTAASVRTRDTGAKPSAIRESLKSCRSLSPITFSGLSCPRPHRGYSVKQGNNRHQSLQSLDLRFSDRIIRDGSGGFEGPLKRKWFGGAEHALRYLGCYTHRVAISNHRLVALEDGQVVFRWCDSAHKNKKRLMRLALDEFLRRFFLHVLPRGFVRIRHFGFFAHWRRAALLPLCCALLGQTGDPQTAADSTPADAPRPLWLCPHCGGAMAILERFTPSEARLRSPPTKSQRL
jgi:hypothetical protein